MSCCPPNPEPARASSTHSGAVVEFGNTTLYRAGPSTAKIGLLAFPDIFGPDSGRTKADADRLGAMGFAVVVVDVMRGDWLDQNTDYLPLIPAFLTRIDFGSVIQSAIENAIAYLKQETKASKICSYGYCFGGWVGARFSTLPKNDIQGHVSFHPSWIVENMIRGEGGVDALARLIVTPQLLLSAGNDPAFVRAGGAVDEILKGKEGRVSKLSRVINFDDVKHGWVNRGDVEDPVVKQSVDKAWTLAVDFIRDASGN